ncbi:hypothetical protein PMIT1313_01997 [Prochlorococcus marinus str. MIT 1313]|nr:hypothetical protein PMIT1313_01997 [Prochlorococcus marinus str. MIT 1313]KZR71382.1 hypothetical protein PMIT1318_02530 [Prochlorococcus marinus str. MIT 1318]
MHFFLEYWLVKYLIGQVMPWKWLVKFFEAVWPKCLALIGLIDQRMPIESHQKLVHVR